MGIVIVIGAIIELSLILFGVFTIPFPQELGNGQIDSQIPGLQEMIEMQNTEQTMSVEIDNEQSLEDQLIDQMQLNEQRPEYPNKDKNIDQINEKKIESQNDVQISSGKGPLPFSMDSDTIIPISECGHMVKDTVPGMILYVNDTIDDPLPLCLTNDIVANWTMTFYVYGGYEPWDGVVAVTQKGELVGFLYLNWHEIPGAMCCYSWWVAHFILMDDICLDSNQYPYVDSYFWLCCDYNDTIPDKEVNLFFYINWTGCISGANQDFQILSV